MEYEINFTYNDWFLWVVMALLILSRLISGALKGIMDSIAHHDSMSKRVPKFLANYFSKKYYYDGKHIFMKKNVWWADKAWRRWIVNNVFAMVIDAWHLSTMFAILLDIIIISLFIWLLFGMFWKPIILLFFAYQIGFRKIYK
jgi:hypothetical protein